jgi:hypothetical protein
VTERIAARFSTSHRKTMRAETEALIEDIKRSLGLLRRHL